MPQREQDPHQIDDDDEEEPVRERDLVEAYVAEHELESALNDVLNQVVACRPADPLLLLSTLLSARATAKRGIFHVEVREALDACGEPTVQVRLHTGRGVFDGCCSAEASGISDGSDTVASGVPSSKQRFGGRGFARIAVLAQKTLGTALRDMEPTDQSALDATLQTLEATLGRNVCLAASLALCQAGAKYAELPLRDYVARLQQLPPEQQCVPMPLFSVLNGGRYAANKLFAQEVLLTPTSAANFADALQIAVEFSASLRSQLDARGVGFTNRGVFGGFAPQLQSLAEVFQALRAALDDTRGRLEDAESDALSSSASASPLRVEFGVDFAASEFVVRSVEHDNDDNDSHCTYNTDQWTPGSTGVLKSSDELLDILRSSVKELELTTVVDPFDARDVTSFAALLSAEHDQDGSISASTDVGDADGKPQDEAPTAVAAKEGAGLGGDPNCRVQIVGRAVVDRLGLAALVEERACNTVLLLAHQFPTVSKLLQAIADAQHLGLAVILGASAGQHGAEDAALLAALAMGAGVGQVKFGGVLSAECLERYRHLLLASEEPGAPPFVGARAFRR